MSKKRGDGSNQPDEWLAPDLIRQHAERLGTFLEAMADGRIDDQELRDQEARVADLMKTVMPKLDESLREEVTRLLCEMSAYDMMHIVHRLMEARSRPEDVWRP